MSAFNLAAVPSQQGRVAIVTGANVGLGFETTKGLASKDMQVIMACRNLEKGKRAKEKILAQYPNANLGVRELDLGNLQSVRDFAANFRATHDRLDLLINNAGVMAPPFSLTDDGFESQLGVNYLSHFVLTGLLLPLLNDTPESRVVTLSSNAHKRGRIHFDDLNFQEDYSRFDAYGQSKLACLMFTLELQRKLEAKGLDNPVSVAAHPGISPTALGRHLPWWTNLLAPLFLPFFTHSPKSAAEPTLYAALGEDVQGGEYFGPGGYREFKGKATKVEPEPHALDKEVAKKLWDVSE
jgi:NAD(P)-dependent dehydrogenase (short-subunit alcohol dehydrogenase family)